MYENNRTEKLSLALFKDPTSEYRGTPFWAWNCALDSAELLRQIDVLHEMGFGGFHMHVRTGMATPYLSEEHMRLVRDCIAKAKENRMLAWLYDEDRWPSGAAGGLVTKDPQYRARYLLFTARDYHAAPSGMTDSSARAAKTGNGRLIASYDVVLSDDGSLNNYRHVAPGERCEGRLWNAYLETPSENPWYNNQTYVNTLDKRAIDRFIEVTYEAYLQACGGDFGKTVPAMFTDEPQFSHKTTLNFAHDVSDVILPWTDDIPESYTAAYQDDILAKLPELIWELPGGRVSQARYRYHDHIAERFAVAFADNCGKWCAEHGLMLTGHMMEEPTLHSQTAALGEAMRSYRGFGLPGIDMLCDSYEFTTAKQAQSASRQFGKSGVLSELYGVTNWDFDFRGHKLQGDWQAALGVTVRVPHLSWVSMAGEAKRDYPASINYQSPWYKEYAYVEDHFARVNTALTRGRAEVHVGVIHPVESYWLYWGPKEQTELIRSQMDSNFQFLTDWLVKAAIDFDFISESLLPIQCEKGGAPLKVGQMAYDVIILPGLKTIRSSTLKRLADFVKAGGRLIVLGEAPELVDAVPSNDGLRLFKDAQLLPYEKSAVLSSLETARIVGLRNDDGSMTGNLITQLRIDGVNKWLFIAQGEPDSNKDVPQAQEIHITVKGLWRPTLYDTLSGTTMPLDCKYQNGSTVITYTLWDHDSLLILLEPGQAVSAVQARKACDAQPIAIGHVLPYTLSEPNVLLLDMAESNLDDGPWMPKEELLRADNVFRAQLGWPSRQDAVAQPWVVPDEPPQHTVTLRFLIRSELAVFGAKLAIEDAERVKLSLNGQPLESRVDGWFTDKAIKTVAMPALMAGENILTVAIPFSRRANIEWCYLLGDFGVRLLGRDAVLMEKPRTLAFGDSAAQGMPFYGANITYHATFDCGGGDVCVHIPNYRGALLRVALDDKESGLIVYAPYDYVFQNVAPGAHKLDISLYGNRFNSFGALHNADDKWHWHGPSAWRTTGDRWCYEYRLRPAGVLTAPTVTLLK